MAELQNNCTALICVPKKRSPWQVGSALVTAFLTAALRAAGLVLHTIHRLYLAAIRSRAGRDALVWCRTKGLSAAMVALVGFAVILVLENASSVVLAPRKNALQGATTTVAHATTTTRATTIPPPPPEHPLVFIVLQEACRLRRLTGLGVYEQLGFPPDAARLFDEHSDKEVHRIIHDRYAQIASHAITTEWDLGNSDAHIQAGTENVHAVALLRNRQARQAYDRLMRTHEVERGILDGSCACWSMEHLEGMGLGPNV